MGPWVRTIEEFEMREVAMEPAKKPLYSPRRLAQYFDVPQDVIIDWWHSGKLPPPDVRMSRKSIYWLPETIESLVLSGGNQ